MPVSCNSIHRPIESIAVFKTASGPSGAACCFVQSSRGCIIKTLNFIEHAEKPIETWRVFPYIDFRMISLKMAYVSLGFKRFEIEVGSRGWSGKYLVVWNLKAVKPCSLAFLLSRASIIVLEFMLKQRLFLKQFSWSSFCQIAFASRSTISFNTVSLKLMMVKMVKKKISGKRKQARLFRWSTLMMEMLFLLCKVGKQSMPAKPQGVESCLLSFFGVTIMSCTRIWPSFFWPHFGFVDRLRMWRMHSPRKLSTDRRPRRTNSGWKCMWETATASIETAWLNKASPRKRKQPYFQQAWFEMNDGSFWRKCRGGR